MLMIRNSYLIDPASGTEGKRDILIDNGRVVKIEKNLLPPAGTSVIDAGGMIVCPGLIDTHSHFRDPGFTYKEDLSTGAESAVKGGYTTIILMANTKPPVDSVPVLQDILERGRRLPVRLYSCANVTKGMAGKELADLAALAECGAAGFTDDGLPIMDGAVLRSALEIAKKLNLPVSLHEEDKSLISENGVNGGGKAAAFLGLAGSPREAEYTLIARDVQIAAELDAPLCVQHISTAEGVDYVRRARRGHPSIHAEATPHHFSLTEDAVGKTFTANGVLDPFAEDKAAFETYKNNKAAALDALKQDGDSAACQKLIADAKAEITAIAFDESKSLDENKAIVDAKVNAVTAKLTADLEAQRASEKPEEQKPAETDKEENETKAPEKCKWCGEDHEGFFGKIVGFFHSVLYFFAHLFGLK